MGEPHLLSQWWLALSAGSSSIVTFSLKARGIDADRHDAKLKVLLVNFEFYEEYVDMTTRNIRVLKLNRHNSLLN